jgi:hypothetical protein
MFFPPGVAADLGTDGRWTDDWVDTINTQVAAFFTAVQAIDVGAVGLLQHVNLSYYQGFTNVTNSSGRTRAAPKYRTSALLDTITGYSAKAVLGSQRRRRTASTY